MLDVAMFLLVSSTEAVQEPPCRPPPAAVCVFVDSPAFPAGRVPLFCIYAYAVWRWNEGGMLNKQIYMSMHNGRGRRGGRVLAGLREEGRSTRGCDVGEHLHWRILEDLVEEHYDKPLTAFPPPPPSRGNIPGGVAWLRLFALPTWKRTSLAQIGRLCWVWHWQSCGKPSASFTHAFSLTGLGWMVTVTVWMDIYGCIVKIVLEV